MSDDIVMREGADEIELLRESVRVWRKVAETLAWTLGVESGYEDPELWRRDLDRLYQEVVDGEWD